MAQQFDCEMNTKFVFLPQEFIMLFSVLVNSEAKQVEYKVCSVKMLEGTCTFSKLIQNV